MSIVLTDPTASPLPQRAAQARPRLDLVEQLFLISAFLAPLSLFVTRSLTAYDVMVAVIAFLIIAGPRRLLMLPRGFTIAAYVFLLAALVSAFRATQPIEALLQTAQFAFIWFIQLPVILTVARSRRVVRSSLGLFITGSLLTMALAMGSQTVQGAGRVLVFYTDNPNRLGYPTAYLLPFVAYFLGEWWRSGRRLLALAVGIPSGYLMLWSLAASASRGATAGVIAAIAVYFLLRPRSGVGVTLLRLLLTCVFTGLTMVFLTRSGLFPFRLEERITRTFDSAERASLVQDRLRLSRAGWEAFQDSPFVGTGLDNFRYVSALWADGSTLQVPHNLWIQFLAQVGIIGTLAFLVFIGKWFLELLRLNRHTLDASSHRFSWAFLASITSILTIFMTIPILNDRHYWLLLGLGLAIAETRNRDHIDVGAAA